MWSAVGSMCLSLQTLSLSLVIYILPFGFGTTTTPVHYYVSSLLLVMTPFVLAHLWFLASVKSATCLRVVSTNKVLFSALLLVTLGLWTIQSMPSTSCWTWPLASSYDLFDCVTIPSIVFLFLPVYVLNHHTRLLHILSPLLATTQISLTSSLFIFTYVTYIKVFHHDVLTAEFWFAYVG